MAAPYNPPKRGEDFIFYVTLEDVGNPGNFKVNPTIAAGDFKISLDDGALTNLTTTPTVSPAGSIWVKITVSVSEMTCDNAKIQGIDQTSPKEWSDFSVCVVTTQ
jgi:hypothetical protein